MHHSWCCVCMLFVCVQFQMRDWTAFNKTKFSKNKYDKFCSPPPPSSPTAAAAASTVPKINDTVNKNNWLNPSLKCYIELNFKQLVFNIWSTYFSFLLFFNSNGNALELCGQQSNWPTNENIEHTRTHSSYQFYINVQMIHSTYKFEIHICTCVCMVLKICLYILHVLHNLCYWRWWCRGLIRSTFKLNKRVCGVLFFFLSNILFKKENK